MNGNSVVGNRCHEHDSCSKSDQQLGASATVGIQVACWKFLGIQWILMLVCKQKLWRQKSCAKSIDIDTS